LKLYLNTFIMGLALGWGACLPFCAPVLLPYIAATRKGWRQGLKISLAFSFSRVVSYIILGLASAGLGHYVVERFYETKAGLLVQVTAGIFITLLGIIILVGRPGHLRSCPGGKRHMPCAGSQGVGEMSLLGLLIGFAPCMPLLGLLTYIAFNTRNLLQGASLGLAFGLGTVFSPLLLFGSLTGAVVRPLFNKPLLYKIFSRACGVILIYLGTGMIIRVLI
jgi:sulfite exporter TauE/SafE